jgi:hypothetical protein
LLLGCRPHSDHPDRQSSAEITPVMVETLLQHETKSRHPGSSAEPSVIVT